MTAPDIRRLPVVAANPEVVTAGQVDWRRLLAKLSMKKGKP